MAEKVYLGALPHFIVSYVLLLIFICQMTSQSLKSATKVLQMRNLLCITLSQKYSKMANFDEAEESFKQ